MEETIDEEKEIKEERKVEEALNMKRRINDQNQKIVPPGTGKGTLNQSKQTD